MRRSISTKELVFMALGSLVGIVAAIIALNRASDDRGHFTPSPNLSEAVADPDNSTPPYLHAHAR